MKKLLSASFKFRVRRWMENHKLKLNDEKTEILICGTRQKIKTIDPEPLTIGGTDVAVTSKAKNLGVIMDSCMTMEHHINMVVKTTSFALRNISRMRQYLSTESIKKVVTSMVLSRLDYCNSLLAGLPDTQLNKLLKNTEQSS